jgi:hypothetical protein
MKIVFTQSVPGSNLGSDAMFFEDANFYYLGRKIFDQRAWAK